VLNDTTAIESSRNNRKEARVEELLPANSTIKICQNMNNFHLEESPVGQAKKLNYHEEEK
jgi:hypothetical protein